MREALIRVDEIPLDGAVTVHLLGREVLVMMLKGKPRAFADVCMHHGPPPPDWGRDLDKPGDRLPGREEISLPGRVLAGRPERLRGIE